MRAPPINSTLTMPRTPPVVNTPTAPCPFRCGLVFRTIHGEQPNLQVDLVDGRVDPPTDKHWNSPDSICCARCSPPQPATRPGPANHSTQPWECGWSNIARCIC